MICADCGKAVSTHHASVAWLEELAQRWEDTAAAHQADAAAVARDNTAMQKRIVELEAEKAAWDAARAAWQRRAEELQRERETTLAGMRAAAETYGRESISLRKDIDRLSAENARLRTALEPTDSDLASYYGAAEAHFDWLDGMRAIFASIRLRAGIASEQQQTTDSEETP